MEHQIRAPHAGGVAALRVSMGDEVAVPPPVVPTGAASAAGDVTCVVPFTTRLTPTKAYRRIKRLGCATTSAPRRAYSAAVKPGRVIRTTPAVGTRTSRPVRLVISRGKRPARRLAGIDDTLQRLTADAALAQRQAEHRP